MSFIFIYFEVKSCFTLLILRYWVKIKMYTNLYFVVLLTETRFRLICDIHKLLRMYKNYIISEYNGHE